MVIQGGVTVVQTRTVSETGEKGMDFKDRSSKMCQLNGYRL